MDKNALNKTLLTGYIAALFGLLPWFYSSTAIAGLELGSQPTIGVTWIERYGFIIHSSICTDYDFGSVDRQECETVAKKIFVDECDAREHLHETDEQRVKFCHAAKLYMPNK